MVFPKFYDNFCRKHCLLTLCCSSHLHVKQFPSIPNRTTYFNMHISISEFVITLCCRYQAVLSCTSKEYSKTWLLPHNTIQPLIPVLIFKEHIILHCITSHNCKEDIYQSHQIVGIGVFACLSHLMSLLEIN